MLTRKKMCHLVDFAVPVDHKVNMKENEKREIYLDLAREIKKLVNMKLTGKPIIVFFGIIPEGQKKSLGSLEI